MQLPQEPQPQQGSPRGEAITMAKALSEQEGVQPAHLAL